MHYQAVGSSGLIMRRRKKGKWLIHFGQDGEMEAWDFKQIESLPSNRCGVWLES